MPTGDLQEVEQVLVVPTELFHELGCFQGFSTETSKYLETLLDSDNTQYLPRDQMEEDPSYKQLIPYCIFQHFDDSGQAHVFRYTRGAGGGETRLRSKKSVGIGGHISTLDANENSPYLVGMKRELDEEILIESSFEEALVGMINDDSNDVGKVHLGIVHQYTVSSPNVRSREDDIAEAGFEPVSSILDTIDQYETWSQFCLKSLYG